MGIARPISVLSRRWRTTRTGNGKVDAFLWVERPGFSNGVCNGGPARAGAWWEERAIQMVERAKWWRGR